jgi:hypothetical protein
MISVSARERNRRTASDEGELAAYHQALATLLEVVVHLQSRGGRRAAADQV